jgi:hypothetical protein
MTSIVPLLAEDWRGNPALFHSSCVIHAELWVRCALSIRAPLDRVLEHQLHFFLVESLVAHETDQGYAHPK